MGQSPNDRLGFFAKRFGAKKPAKYSVDELTPPEREIRSSCRSASNEKLGMPRLFDPDHNLHRGSAALRHGRRHGIPDPQCGEEDGTHRSKSYLRDALLRCRHQHPNDTSLVDLFLRTKTAGIGIRMTNQSPLPITLEEINRNLAGRFVLDPGQSEGDCTFWKRYLLPNEGECHLRAYTNKQGQIWKVVSFAYSATDYMSDQSNHGPFAALEALQHAIPPLVDSARVYWWIGNAVNGESFSSRDVQIKISTVEHTTPELTTRPEIELTVTSTK